MNTATEVISSEGELIRKALGEQWQTLHPEIQKRNFVLIPLCDIAENFIHPNLKKTIRTLLKGSSDDSIVDKLSSDM